MEPSAAAAVPAPHLTDGSTGRTPTDDVHKAADLPQVSVLSKGAKDVNWVQMCGAIERKCFAKHEAMDVAKEVKGRGVTLLCAALIEDPATCAGFAVVQRSSLALAITKLVVVPHLRRRGVGRALMCKAIASARQGRARA